MSRTASLLPLLLVVVALAPADAQETDPPPHFADDALAKLIAAVVPGVEKAAGAAFETPPRLKRVTSAQLTEALGAVLIPQMQSLFPQRPKDEVAGHIRPMLPKYARERYALYAVSTNTILVAPAHFQRMAEANQRPELAAAPFLRAIVTHEAVHAWHQQRYQAMSRFYSVNSEPALRVWTCLVEGHAQHVAEKALKADGLAAAFATMHGVLAPDPSSKTWQGYQFFRKLADWDDVTPAAFRAFPRSMSLILDPAAFKRYRVNGRRWVDLRPSFWARLREAPAWKQLRGPRRMPPEEAHEMLHARLEPTKARAALEGLVGLEVAVVRLDGGALQLRVHQTTGETAAKALYDGLETMLRSQDPPNPPWRGFKVLKATYGTLEGVQAAHLYTHKTIHPQPGPPNPVPITSVELRVGAYVVDMTYSNLTVAPAQLEADLRRVVAAFPPKQPDEEQPDEDQPDEEQPDEEQPGGK